MADSPLSCSAIAARYGVSEGFPAPMSEVIEALLAHRSVRAYTADPLPEGTLAQLVAAAQSAATSSNLQVWSVVAVRDPARKSRLAKLAGNQAHIEQAPLFLIWLADLSRAARVGLGQEVELGAVHYTEAFLVGVIDAALAAQNAVVAAESLGLGTVYIGGMRNHPEEVAAELGLPPMVMPVFGLCVGYEDASRPASVKPRLPQSVVLHHERYDAPNETADVAAYDEVAREFQLAQGMKPQGWSPVMIDRWRDAAALRGRDRMSAALRALGFVLR